MIEGKLIYESAKYMVRMQDNSKYYILHRKGDEGNAFIPVDRMESMRPSDYNDEGKLVKVDEPIDRFINDFFLDGFKEMFPRYEVHDRAVA